MSRQIDRDQLTAGLAGMLPAGHAAAAPALGALLADALQGRLSAAEVERQLQAAPALRAALCALRGSSIPTGTGAVAIAGADGEEQITVSDTAGVSQTLRVSEPDLVQQINISGGSVGQIIGKQIVYHNTLVSVTPVGTRLDPAEPVSPTRLRALPRPPRPIRNFLDRTRALDDIRAELRPGGGAWLSGAPGCGLSALLRQATNDPLAGSFADGVLYIDGGHEAPFLDDVIQNLFARFYTSPVALKLDVESARVYLGQIQALFALDRLPLSKAELAELADILRDGSVLIAADHAAVDTLQDVALAGLPPPDAQALIARLAPVDAGDAPEGAVAELCGELDYLPLPLVLAAQLLRRAARGSGGGVAKQLGHLIEVLTARDSTALDRVVEVILGELETAQLAALRALIGVGGPDVALDALCAISAQPPATAERALDSLIELRMVSGSGGRYELANFSIRRSLARLLDTTEERRRAALFFAARAGDLEWAARERGNLSAAIETLAADGSAAQAGVVTRAVQPALVLGGLWGSWGAVSSRLEQVAATAADAPLRAWALHEQGTRSGLLGDMARAAAQLGEALAIREQLGDRASADLTLHNMDYLGLLPPPPDHADDAGAHADGGGGAALRPGALALVGMALIALIVAAVWLWLRSPGQLPLLVEPAVGSYPLTVRLRSGQEAGDDQAYIYRWDFGDGSTQLETRDPEVSHVYTAVGSYTAALTVCNERGRCAATPATALITVRNEPPLPAISSPAAGGTFAAATPIHLLGSASDPEDGELPDERLSWRVTLREGATLRELPVEPGVGGPTFSVPADALAGPGDPAELVVELSARDSLGATAVISQILRPEIVTVELRSAPPGRALLVAGQEVTPPYQFEAWAGAQIALAARDQVGTDGVCHVFEAWSDGGAADHMITAASQTLNADFHKLSVSLVAAAITVGEDAERVELVVALDRASRCQVSLSYATRDDTATAGEDYTASAGSVTIGPGEQSATLEIPIVNDDRAEGAERFELSLNELSGAAPGDILTTVVTIQDGDALPLVGFTQSDLRVTEGDGTAFITAILSSPSGAPVSVDYAVVPGTATEGQDYTPVQGTLSFAPDETSQSFSIPLAKDALDEANETLELRLSSPTNAEPGQASATLTIVDDDAPPAIGLGAASYEVAEDSGSATVTVALDAASGRPVTVLYASAPGTAEAPGDFTLVSGTLSFAPGDTIRTFSVPIRADDHDEERESVLLSLTDATNATLARAEATLFIANDDPLPSVAFASAAYAGEEGTEVAVVVQVQPHSGKSVTVDYTVRRGTASANDYNLASGTLTFGWGEGEQTIVVQLNEDSDDEPDESLSIVLSSPGNAVLGQIGVTTVTIVDNDVPRVSISGPQLVNEQGQAPYPARLTDNFLSLTVRLDRRSWQEVRVSLAAGARSDTATLERDYALLSNTVIFKPGEQSQTVRVRIIDDASFEGGKAGVGERFTVRLVAPVHAELAADQAQVVVTIIDNEFPPVP